MQWFREVFPVLRRLRQEDYEFKARLSYMARFFLKRKKKE